jgi:hypothetical protein
MAEGDDIDAILAKHSAPEEDVDKILTAHAPVGVAPPEAPAAPKGFTDQLSDQIKSLTLPTSWSDVKARVSQNLPELGRQVAQPFKDIAGNLASANDAATRVLFHPVSTLGGGRAVPAIRETMRGVNSNIPFANSAVEALGGPPAVSTQDAAAAPGFQALGGMLGTPAAGAVGGIIAKPIEAAVPVLGRALGGLTKEAAEERQITRAVEDLGENLRKGRVREGVKTKPVESLVREEPALRSAIGNDEKVAATIDRVKTEAQAELGRIYSESASARSGIARDLETLKSRAAEARATAKELRAKASPETSLFDEARKIDAPIGEKPSLFDLARQVDAPLSPAAAKDAGRAAFAEKQAAREAEAKAAGDAAAKAEQEADRLEKSVSEHSASIASSSAPPVEASAPIAKLDARISTLRSSKIPSKQATADALENMREKLAESLGSGGVSPQKLREIQSDFQKTGYGKALPGDVAATARIEAAREASKAVGDSVIQHVTGLDYAGAQAEAAANPNGLAARLLRANKRIEAVNKIEASIEERAKLAKPREGIVGKAQKLAHVLRHPTESIPAAVDATVRAADARLSTGGISQDGMLARIARAAAQGNLFAQRQLRLVAASPAGAARLAAIQAQDQAQAASP